jgi:flavin-dependent dehydrogenase
MSHDYDAVVVGARLAGSATAMLLARSGHRVLLVDRVTMPADTVSTHAMLRSGVLQLQRWGLLDRIVEAGAPAVREVTLGFGEERIAISLSTDHGVDALYAPRRFIVDALLQDAAVAAGAEFRSGIRMSDVLRDASRRVAGVVVTDGPTESSITARIVIGADGVYSRTAQLVAAPTYASHPPTNAVHYAYFTGISWPGFWFQFTPGVNAGFVETNEDATLVFVARSKGRMPAFRGDPESEFHRLLTEAGPDLAALAADGDRISEFRGTTGLPGFLRRPWGPGWALVGDAGYTKDPISAHGMSDALRDAELCARAVDRALRRPEEAAAAMDSYQMRRDALSRPMFRESKVLAAYGWDSAEASRRMRVISQTVHEECDAILAMPRWDPATAPRPVLA